MLTISPISTNFYTNNNCRKPCFKAGMSNEALYDSMAMLTKELEPKLKNVTATKKTKRPLFQWFLNIFKSHKTNNISESSKIDSPTGKLELPHEGAKQYSEVAALFARSAKIDSPIGKLELSPEGAKQYSKVAALYAQGFPQSKDYAAAKTQVIKAELMMEVLGSLGEFSTEYNDVISSKTFGEIKVTEKGLKQYLDAINIYAQGFPQSKDYAAAKTQVINAEQIINIIKGNGEY